MDGPVGGTRQIGKQFFEDYAVGNQFEILRNRSRGLIPAFAALEQNNPSLTAVAQPVRDFYERTSEFDMDAWSNWCGAFKPFGRALSLLFSRRLQQLNVPLSPLDPSKGITSTVMQMRNQQTGNIQTAWVRELHATGNVLYAGCYSLCNLPGHPSPCIKVVFPLPNGSAIVIMKAEAHRDGSLSVRSIGHGFGEPGFYFVVHQGDGVISARYVRSLKEEIRVYSAEKDTVRADHILWLWGTEFLRLHYRMRRYQPS